MERLTEGWFETGAREVPSTRMKENEINGKKKNGGDKAWDLGLGDVDAGRNATIASWTNEREAPLVVEG